MKNVEEASLYEYEAMRMGSILQNGQGKHYMFADGVYELIRRKLIFSAPEFDRQQHELREELEEREFYREIVLKDYIQQHNESIHINSYYCPKCGNIATKGYADTPSPVNLNGRLDEAGLCFFCHDGMKEFYDYALFQFDASAESLESNQAFFPPFTAREYETIRKKYVYTSSRFNILLFEKREKLDKEMTANNVKNTTTTYTKKLINLLPSNKGKTPAEEIPLTMYDLLKAQAKVAAQQQE